MAPDRAPESHKQPPFSRVIAPAEPSASRQSSVEATPSERAGLAVYYGVETIASLRFDYSIDALPSQRFRLTGEVRGELTQLCGVTLDPVEESICEPVSIEYWPEHLLIEAGAAGGGAEELLDADPPEPLVNGRIDLGMIAAEIFASAINPYPRKEGAAFDWSDGEAEKGESSAFAALRRLKPQA